MKSQVQQKTFSALLELKYVIIQDHFALIPKVGGCLVSQLQTDIQTFFLFFLSNTHAPLISFALLNSANVMLAISKVNPTKKLLLSMLPVPIQEKHKKTGRDHLLSLVMTENEMAQNKEESQVMLFEDPLHLLDRLPFYSETAKVQAGIFHSMENRVENLSKCFAECLTIHQKEQQKVKGAKGKSNGPRKTVTLMEKVILDILKINLPWKTQSVIESVEACSENSTFVQIYLCPLRQHYGKTKGSKTGDLLSMIENHFWTGIQKLM